MESTRDCKDKNSLYRDAAPVVVAGSTGGQEGFRQREESISVKIASKRLPMTWGEASSATCW